MTVEQYSALVTIMPQIESLLAQKGETVPRPHFDGAPQGVDEENGDEQEEAEPGKANIEATSDEDE